MSGSQGTGVNQRSSATALTSNESITVLFPKNRKKTFSSKREKFEKKPGNLYG